MKNVHNQRRTVPYRRKREGKTNYRSRIALIAGRIPRLVVRKSLQHIVAQIVEYSAQGDKIVTSAHSRELKQYGITSTSNIPSAYLIGLLIAKRAKEKKIKQAVLDTGLVTLHKGGCIYAVLKGAIDAGLEIPHSKEILPSQERISGAHLHHAKADIARKAFEKAKGALL